MAINIKDPDTDRLARELAELTGQPITQAERIAIEERLAQLRRRQAITGPLDPGEIITRGRQRRLLDERDETESLGYDVDSGGADIQQGSTSGTATRTPWRASPISRCSTRATTSPRPTSQRRPDRRRVPTPGR